LALLGEKGQIEYSIILKISEHKLKKKWGNSTRWLATEQCDIFRRGLFNLSHNMSKRGLLEEFWGPFGIFLYGMSQKPFDPSPPLSVDGVFWAKFEHISWLGLHKILYTCFSYCWIKSELFYNKRLGLAGEPSPKATGGAHIFSSITSIQISCSQILTSPCPHFARWE
jgi:hypothetical protein